MRDQALAVCQVAGADEVGDFRASSLPTLVEMVSSGIGVTLLPSLAIASIKRTGAALSLIPFSSKGPARTIGLAYRKSTARASEFALLASLFEFHAGR